MTTLPIVCDFNDINRHDSNLVGERGALLGEIAKIGIPILTGFVITVNVFDSFLAENEVAKKIDDILATVDIEDPVQLSGTARRIQKIIHDGKVPEDAAATILDYYNKLSAPEVNVALSVQGKENDFIEEQNILTTKGDANLILTIKEALASCFTPKLIYNANKKNLKVESVDIALVVTLKLTPHIAGVVFSIDYEVNDKNKFIIEVEDDQYVVQKNTYEIVSGEFNKNKADEKISASQIVELAKISDKLQKHFYFPQQTEWIKVKGRLYVTLTGGITRTFSSRNSVGRKEPGSIATKPLVKHTRYKQKTATKVYVNVESFKNLTEIKSLNIDGLVLWSEQIIKNMGFHPKDIIKKGEQEQFVDKLTKSLEKIAKEFYGHPVVLRTSDIKTNEYSLFPEGHLFESPEVNPLLGFHGAFRHINNPEPFNLELLALKRARESHLNLELMIPFCRNSIEFSKIRHLVASAGLFESLTFKFLLECGIPANVVEVDDFIKVGLNGVFINLESLTMLFTASSPEIFNNSNQLPRSVLSALTEVVKKCADNKTQCIVYLNSKLVDTDLIKKLVKLGVHALSVNPNTVDRTREIIRNGEEEI